MAARGRVIAVVLLIGACAEETRGAGPNDAAGMSSADVGPTTDATDGAARLDSGVACGVAVPPGCTSALDRAACEAVAGNYFDRWQRCLCPTPDAECPCTSSSQCAGECLARGAGSVDACRATREGRCSRTYETPSCACLLGPDDLGAIAEGESRIRCAD